MHDVALTNTIIENYSLIDSTSQDQDRVLVRDKQKDSVATENSAGGALGGSSSKRTFKFKTSVDEIIDSDTSLTEYIEYIESKQLNNSQQNMKQQNLIVTVSETDQGRSNTSLNRNSPQVRAKLNAEEKKPVRVTSRIVFLKLGQIDTRNERYDAEAYIECSWEDEKIFKLLSDPNMQANLKGPHSIETLLKNVANTPLNPNNLINLKNIINNIKYLEYDPNVFWSPQLYIENAIGDLKEEIKHKLEIVEKEGSDLLNDPNFNTKSEQSKNLYNNLTIRVVEMRKLRGVFYERLELYDFPMDMQELSITLTSKKNIKEVEIIENKKDPCSINTEDFLDQQEWDLFGHVTTSKKTIYDPWRKFDRTAYTVTCFIARKPGYYLYNAYMLIFLITILGFVPFAFDPSSPQFRCQVTGLLLLTSVNFRWIVTQRLPSVPYLTSLDKYAIGSLLHLVLFCVWHSIIGSNIIVSSEKDNLSYKRTIDTYVLACSAGFFILYNLFYIIWFFKMYRSINKFHKESLKKVKQRIEISKRNQNESVAKDMSMNAFFPDLDNLNQQKLENNKISDVTLNQTMINLNSNTNNTSTNSMQTSSYYQKIANQNMQKDVGDKAKTNTDTVDLLKRNETNTKNFSHSPSARSRSVSQPNNLVMNMDNSLK